MIGKVVAGMLSVVMVSFLIIVISFYFLQETVKGEVNQLTYHTAEVLSTNGILTTHLYGSYKDQLSRYGDYHVRLKLEKQIKPGVYDIFFQEEDIIDKRLAIGDRLTIFVEDRNPSLFNRFLSAGFLRYHPTHSAKGGIQVIKTAVIARNAKDLVKGYDVIAEIDKQSMDPRVAVFVQTKAVDSGKYYGDRSHEDVLVNNPYYGDDADEKAPHEKNYIFENGDFLRSIEYYGDGSIRLIRFIQQ